MVEHEMNSTFPWTGRPAFPRHVLPIHHLILFRLRMPGSPFRVAHEPRCLFDIYSRASRSENLPLSLHTRCHETSRFTGALFIPHNRSSEEFYNVAPLETSSRDFIKLFPPSFFFEQKSRSTYAHFTKSTLVIDCHPSVAPLNNLNRSKFGEHRKSATER